MFKLKIFSIVIVSVMFISAGVLFAQAEGINKQKKTPEERAKMMTDKLNDIVQLSTDQYSTIYDLLLNNIQQNVSDRKTYTGSKEDLKFMIKERNKATRQKIRTLLTDDQIAKLKEYRKQHKPQGQINKQGYRNNRGNKVPPPYNY